MLKKWLDLCNQIKGELKFSNFEIIFILLFGIVNKLSYLINPLILGNIIDGIINKNYTTIRQYIIFAIIIFILNCLITYIGNIFIIRLKNIKYYNISSNLMRNILKTNIGQMKKLDISYIINILDNDTYEISKFLFDFIDLFIKFFISIISFLFMLNIDLILSLTSLLYFILGAMKYIISGKKYNMLNKDYKETSDDYMSYNIDTFSGFKDIIIFNAGIPRLKCFNIKLKNLILVEKNIDKLDIYNSLFINILSFIFGLLNLYLGITKIKEGSISLGALIAFYDYKNNFDNALSNFGGLNKFVHQTDVSYRRYEKLKEVQISDRLLGSICIDSIKEIKFENLNVYTDDKKQLIYNFNYVFTPGKLYCIKGSNGSGKSTLLDVIAGINYNYDGKILYNGKELNKINFCDLNNKIGYILQNNYIFSTTIGNNVLMGRNKNYKLPKHISNDLINKNIDYNNHKMSGGEVKRISLMRTFLFDYDVYLLDEIFVGLDKETKNKIVDYIKILSKNKIVIYIDHGSELKIKDQIIINIDNQL